MSKQQRKNLKTKQLISVQRRLDNEEIYDITVRNTFITKAISINKIYLTCIRAKNIEKEILNRRKNV